MHLDYFSTYLYFQFLPSKSYSPQCTDLLLLWSHLFYSILLFLMLLGIALFYFFFRYCIVCIGIQTISVCLYHVTLLNSLINSNSVLVESWGFFIYKMYHLQMENNYFSFMIRMPFLCLIAQYQKKCFQLFTADVGGGLLTCDLYYIEVCSFNMQFIESLYHERIYSVRCFFSIYRGNHMIFIVSSTK